MRADGPSRVIAQHQGEGQRDGKTLATKRALTFEVRGDTIIGLTDATDDESSGDAFCV